MNPHGIMRQRHQEADEAWITCDELSWRIFNLKPMGPGWGESSPRDDYAFEGQVYVIDHHPIHAIVAHIAGRYDPHIYAEEVIELWQDS